MRKIKLMADYQCSPLWEASECEVGNIDPNSLPISEELKNKLLEWSKMYDDTLNMNDPLNSGFDSLRDAENFIQIGEELRVKLQEELGSEVIVTMFPAS